ncbi:MAG: tetratricopeptide repeat protein [Flavobacteriaceae bacterium]
MPKQIYFWVLTFFAGWSLTAQESEVINHIFDGNQQIETESFDEAEMDYRRALSKAPEKPEALFNLGNTHYQEQDYEEAKQRYFQTQKFTENKSSKHHAFHNLGNVFMKQKDYAKAVEVYKNALRSNPQDEETRYNYALAKELLEKEKEQQEQNQDQNDQQDQDNQEDQKDQDKENQNNEGDKDKDSGKDNKDQEGDEGEDQEDKKDDGNQDKENQPNQGEPEKEQPSQPRQTELSPQQVKSLLEAMSNQEKKVQDKVNAEKVQGTPVRGQKDW